MDDAELLAQMLDFSTEDDGGNAVAVAARAAPAAAAPTAAHGTDHAVEAAPPAAAQTDDALVASFLGFHLENPAFLDVAATEAILGESVGPQTLLPAIGPTGPDPPVPTSEWPANYFQNLMHGGEAPAAAPYGQGGIMQTSAFGAALAAPAAAFASPAPARDSAAITAITQKQVQQLVGPYIQVANMLIVAQPARKAQTSQLHNQLKLALQQAGGTQQLHHAVTAFKEGLRQLFGPELYEQVKAQYQARMPASAAGAALQARVPGHSPVPTQQQQQQAVAAAPAVALSAQQQAAQMLLQQQLASQLVLGGPPPLPGAVPAMTRLEQLQAQRAALDQQLQAAQVAQELENSVDRMYDEPRAAKGPRPRLNAAPEIRTPLHPHQQEALAWMCQRENNNSLPPFWHPRVAAAGGALTYVSSLTGVTVEQRPAPVRGGLLADDMGLGKTLVVISLICTNRPGAQQLHYFPPVDGGAAEAGPAAAAAAAAAGQREAAAPGEGTEEPNPKRQRTAKESSTISALQQEAEEWAAAEEPPPSLPAGGGPRATLIVCPSSVISNWEMQIEQHTAGHLKVRVHHGSSRIKNAATLSEHDVVITTVGTVREDAKRQIGVCLVDWLRVVLDEAHDIRNAKTKGAKAAHALKAQRRWALTGTPVQNRLADLHGICRFLQLEPLDDKKIFNRFIQSDGPGETRLQVLVASMALRRTKNQPVNGQPLMALPSKKEHRVLVQLGAEARDKYELWQEAAQVFIERHVAEGTLMRNYITVLEILLRLRQICCDPTLAPEEHPAALLARKQAAAEAQLTPELTMQLIELLKAGLDAQCPKCWREMSKPVITGCQHVFCRRCIKGKPFCPLCDSPISEEELVAVARKEAAARSRKWAAAAPDAGSTSSGSVPAVKVAALLERLRKDAAESAAAAAEGSQAGPIRSVVFSQFTSFLDLVQPLLVREGYSVARLDGKTPTKRRKELVRSFQSGATDGPTVLLVSLKAGGVGLNLVAACRVHLLDPWWNPAVEEQAMDRVHRLGQTQPVHVYKYTVQDSIEQRMLVLQEEKLELMQAAFGQRKSKETQEARVSIIRELVGLPALSAA